VSYILDTNIISELIAKQPINIYSSVLAVISPEASMGQTTMLLLIVQWQRLFIYPILD